MPLHRATEKGRSGWRFGHAKFYTSRAKAARQGRAIEASKARRR